LTSAVWNHVSAGGSALANPAKVIATKVYSIFRGVIVGSVEDAFYNIESFEGRELGMTIPLF